MDLWHDFPGPNAAYIQELYERYRHDPAAVDAATAAIFAAWSPDGRDTAAAVAAPPTPATAEAQPAAPTGPVEAPPAPELAQAPAAAPAARAGQPALEKIVAAARLAQAMRAYGHRAARLDPLGSPPPGDPALEATAYGLSAADLTALPASLAGGPAASTATNAAEALAGLRAIYCGTIGYDFDHIHDPVERTWLRDAAEAQRYRPPADPIDPAALLARLTEVEVFEQFLHRVFPGRTRFSIEGVDMLVPMLDEVVAAAAGGRSRTIFIGMAHRGRLNVLAHVLNKPYAQILAEFKDPVMGHNWAVRDDLGWTGDVKYHKGAMRALRAGEATGGRDAHDGTALLRIYMPPNPSHLEYVNPVVAGMARAAATQMDAPGVPRYDPEASLPILIHGDASFPGQGIVAETLNLSQAEGYRAGGVLHIITNNQLGFTARPDEARSTLYASDLAKGFGIPVVHVNADDVVACIEVTRLACAYRARFQKDFLIDLVGYRRYGHNEGDEPSFTQPLMYRAIEGHPSVRKLWADHLVEQGLVTEEAPADLVRRQFDAFQGVLDALRAEEEVSEPQIVPPPRGTAGRVKTAVSLTRLAGLNEALLAAPEGFTFNPKLARARQRRAAAFAADHRHDAGLDWGAAEELALATLLEDGVPVRLTGQDSGRGTFNQRHAMFYDFDTGAVYVPLQHLTTACAAFQVANSPLSENAALGFEYGYNLQAPERLVIWEAQYGDFINGAQGIVDEFIVSGRAKWEETPSLVILLPHGFEGQGPDHSSGRPERFLQLAAEINLRLAYPTTASQYFHLLRRQAALLAEDPLPLIVLTPKSLLRHPLAASAPVELAEGSWQPVIDDARARTHPGEVRRLILCSGKIYVDLVSSKRYGERTDIAIARVEQLYLFPDESICEIIAGYPKLEMVIWVQEEPENMGAWSFVRPRLAECLGERYPLHFVGRPPSSSPAEGSTALHLITQSALVEQAYNLEGEVERREIVWVKKE